VTVENKKIVGSWPIWLIFTLKFQKTLIRELNLINLCRQGCGINWKKD